MFGDADHDGRKLEMARDKDVMTEARFIRGGRWKGVAV